MASAYGYIDRLVEDGAARIGEIVVSGHFLEVIYVFLLCFGVFSLLALCWHWISKVPFISRLLCDKSATLGDLYGEIVQRRDELIAVIDERKETPETLAYIVQIHELYESLKVLGIRCPKQVPTTELTDENKEALTTWIKFLMRLAAMARHRDLKGARALVGSGS